MNVRREYEKKWKKQTKFIAACAEEASYLLGTSGCLGVGDQGGGELSEALSRVELLFDPKADAWRDAATTAYYDACESPGSTVKSISKLAGEVMDADLNHYSVGREAAYLFGIAIGLRMAGSDVLSPRRP